MPLLSQRIEPSLHEDLVMELSLTAIITLAVTGWFIFGVGAFVGMLIMEKANDLNHTDNRAVWLKLIALIIIGPALVVAIPMKRIAALQKRMEDSESI